MKISIIIPTCNEEKTIVDLIHFLQLHSKEMVNEIIVVDGGSDDNTVQLALDTDAVVLDCPEKGRAVQMNYGADYASGEVYYFVHGDVIPPKSYVDDILSSLQLGHEIGCYRFQFNSPRKILKINAFFTRFDKMWCRGGDQTLYVTKELFEELGGYNTDYCIMEEYDFIKRARETSEFMIIPKDVIVSARKYENNSYFKVMVANAIAFNMFNFGVPPKIIHKTYEQLLD